MSNYYKSVYSYSKIISGYNIWSSLITTLSVLIHCVCVLSDSKDGPMTYVTLIHLRTSYEYYSDRICTLIVLSLALISASHEH